MRNGLIALSVICLLMFIANVHAGEDRRFEEQRLAMAKSIKSILIEAGACVSDNDCNKKKLLFVGPGRSGIGIQLYGVNDHEVVEKITNECMMKFFELDSEMRITLKVYHITKDEDLKRPFWQPVEPKVVIEFKGSE